MVKSIQDIYQLCPSLPAYEDWKCKLDECRYKCKGRCSFEISTSSTIKFWLNKNVEISFENFERGFE